MSPAVVAHFTAPRARRRTSSDTPASDAPAATRSNRVTSAGAGAAAAPSTVLNGRVARHRNAAPSTLISLCLNLLNLLDLWVWNNHLTGSSGPLQARAGQILLQTNSERLRDLPQLGLD